LKKQKLFRAPSTALVYVFDHDRFYEESMAEFGGVLIEDLSSEVNELKKERQGLISGAEALRALADGKEVEANNIDFGYWIDARNLNVTDFFDDIHTFRLKPRTITLSLEIPVPFEPNDGEEAWCLDGNTLNGYKKVICDDFIDSGIGFWRTEEEIKQVVAALRGIKG